MLAALRHESNRIEFLGIPLHTIGMDEAIRLAKQSMRERQRLQHGDVNVAKLAQMKDDPDLLEHTLASDLICVDGMGIVLGCRLFGHRVESRVTGIDFMQEILLASELDGYRPFFLGAKQDVLEDMIAALKQRHPGLEVAGYRNGYFSRCDEESIVAEINASGADCLFVGISSPIKERFLNQYRDRLNVPLQIGVGGSFDVLSGHVRRAPASWQRLGFEWLFRLLQEPNRLFSRYLYTNTRYAWFLLKSGWSNAVRNQR